MNACERTSCSCRTRRPRGAWPGAGPAQIADYAGRIDANIAAIGKIWEKVLTHPLDSEEKVLVERYADHRKAFVNDGLKTGVALAQARRFDDLDRHASTVVTQLFDRAKVDAERLLQIQVDQAKAEYDRVQGEYRTMLVTVLGMLGLALLVGVLLGV